MVVCTPRLSARIAVVASSSCADQRVDQRRLPGARRPDHGHRRAGRHEGAHLVEAVRRRTTTPRAPRHRPRSRRSRRRSRTRRRRGRHLVIATTGRAPDSHTSVSSRSSRRALSECTGAQTSTTSTFAATTCSSVRAPGDLAHQRRAPRHARTRRRCRRRCRRAAPSRRRRAGRAGPGAAGRARAPSSSVAPSWTRQTSRPCSVTRAGRRSSGRSGDAGTGPSRGRPGGSGRTP